MVSRQLGALALSLLATQQANAFVGKPSASKGSCDALCMSTNKNKNDRRSFLSQSAAAAALLVPATFGLSGSPEPASAKVYLDPALYGDQELRQSAVNSLKESVRRAILQDPQLAPSFYQLALLDGLSYDAATGEYGPDGRVVSAALSSKDESAYTKNLQKACNTLIQSCINLKKLTSITIADAVALGGAAAVESIGGPFLTVQLGRTDAPKKSPLSPLNLNVLSGTVPSTDVNAAFRRSGLTEREMTTLLGTLLTLDLVQKTRSTADWKASAKPKFREPGKIGRASEFKPLTDQDIADMESADYDDEDDLIEGDENIYIAESFGRRDEVFGAKVGGGDISEKNFNKYLQALYSVSGKKGGGDASSYGWIGTILLDKNNPTVQAWLAKYAGSYLSYNKDLSVAYNAITQLGAEYTGGKYESLLKNRKRKTLNDD